MSVLPKAVTPQDVYRSEAEIERQREGSLLPHVEAINKMLLASSTGCSTIPTP